jgi:hypothetical protein
MEFITEDGYVVKPGMEEEYQRWVVDHAAEFRASLPPGIEYIGTYVMVFGSDQASGGWRDMFRLDSYAALDRMAAASKDADSTFGRLVREANRFIDLDRSPERWTHNLYKSVVDATVIDTPQEAPERELVGAGR